MRYPLSWREALCYRNQLIVFTISTAIVLLISCLPLLGVCELELLNKWCIIKQDGSVKCWVCYTCIIGVGLILPIVLILLLYGLIYHIVRKAQRLHQSLSRSSQLSSPGDPQSASSLDKLERTKFPWSIVIILILNILSTLPWFIFNVNPRIIIMRRTTSFDILALDILYSVQLICLGISPIAYIITTRTVRQKIYNLFKVFFRKLLGGAKE